MIILNADVLVTNGQTGASLVTMLTDNNPQSLKTILLHAWLGEFTLRPCPKEIMQQNHKYVRMKLLIVALLLTAKRGNNFDIQQQANDLMGYRILTRWRVQS